MRLFGRTYDMFISYWKEDHIEQWHLKKNIYVWLVENKACMLECCEDGKEI